MKEYVDKFNGEDKEIYTNYIPNNASYDWMASHIPLIDIPDKEIEQVYYFRWWTFRKHIKKTPTGFVITEFLPSVSWAGKHNTISCACGHHIREGRWLGIPPENNDIIKDYINYWYNESDNLNAYSNWLDWAVYGLCELRGDYSIVLDNLDRMVYFFNEREKTNFRSDVGLFWSECDRDGQEYAISGNGFRLPLNCYAAANAEAIANTASLAGKHELAAEFRKKAETLKDKINSLLWSQEDQFFLNIACFQKDGKPDYKHSEKNYKIVELWGYTPWYFNLAIPGKEEAFSRLDDSRCFAGKYGLVVADRSHPCYFRENQEIIHECLWNGPVWPFSTSIALSALANSSRKNDGLFYRLLKQYAASHHLDPADKTSSFWIDENMNPDTGEWISRSMLMHWGPHGWDKNKGGEERGKDYNHSTFCDIVISGLFGIRTEKNTLTAKPLFPNDWQEASIHNIPFHGKLYSIYYKNNNVSIIEDVE